MKIYDNFTDSNGQQWDLNNPETYMKSWFPNEFVDADAVTLRMEIADQIGHSLYYMICWMPDSDWDKRSGVHPGQYYRVVEFGKHFAKESREPDRYENTVWLKKQLLKIIDETENQC